MTAHLSRGRRGGTGAKSAATGPRGGTAGLLLVLAAFATGCGRTPTVGPEDGPTVEALARYEPRYKLDNQGRVMELWLETQEVDDAALEPVSRLDELRGLSLYGSSVTDRGLAHLRGLKLETLGLGATRVTDKGLDHVETLSRLRHIWLPQTRKITAERVEALKDALPGLGVHHQ